MAPEGLFPGWQCCLTHPGCQDSACFLQCCTALCWVLCPKALMCGTVHSPSCDCLGLWTDTEWLCWTSRSPVACEPGSVLKYHLQQCCARVVCEVHHCAYITNGLGATRSRSARASFACYGYCWSQEISSFCMMLPALHYPPKWKLSCGGHCSDSVRSWKVGREDKALLPPLWVSLSTPGKASKQASIKNTFLLKL